MTPAKRPSPKFSLRMHGGALSDTICQVLNERGEVAAHITATVDGVKIHGTNLRVSFSSPTTANSQFAVMLNSANSEGEG
jgi:hypothetical protein